MLLSALLVRTAQEIKVVHLARLGQASLNFPALSFAAAITLLVSILLTILPAMRSLRPALLTDLSNGSARSSGSKGLHRAGRLLVASQLALALVLVASAGWMASSVFILLHQPLGFDPDHLLFASTNLRGPVRDPESDPARTIAVLNKTLADLRAVPGVDEVAAANDKPLGGRVNQYDFCSDLHPEACNQPHLKTPDVFQVTPGYFHTMSQLLYRGRDFNAADDGRNHVAIVNQSLANQEWPGENPIGHRIFTGELKTWATVVGEAGDVHSYSLERAPVPNLYLPEADDPDVHMTVMMRTAGDPAAMGETIRRLLRSNSQITTNNIESMPELMGHQVALRQFALPPFSMRFSLGSNRPFIQGETSCNRIFFSSRRIVPQARRSLLRFVIHQGPIAVSDEDTGTILERQDALGSGDTFLKGRFRLLHDADEGLATIRRWRSFIAGNQPGT
jgi:hypothetical protein